MQLSKRFAVHKIDTHTSGGVLSKGWYDSPNGLVLVKGNAPNCYEPYAEAIVSDILDALNLEHIRYHLEPSNKYPQIKSSLPHVSVCEQYKPNCQVLPLWQYLDLLGGKDYWNLFLKSDLPLHILKEMLYIDAFVANTDRHLSNIEVEIYTTGTTLAPMFDFGASLGLTNPPNYAMGDKAKPFKETHSRQLHLIARYVPNKIQTKLSRQEAATTVVRIIADYVAYLPIDPTEELLHRMHYLDELFEWRQS